MHFDQAQVAAKDSKLDRVESQMLDSYDNDKKVTVLARIQVGASPAVIQRWRQHSHLYALCLCAFATAAADFVVAAAA